MSSVPSLPEEVWKLILQRVPLRERLGSCAVVSTTLHKAALAATYQVEVEVLSTKQADCFLEWLEHHGRHLTLLVYKTDKSLPTLSRLSCQNLCQLQLSRCSVQLGPSSSHPGVLQVCTALTKLVLSQCALVCGRTSLDRCTSLTALSAVPALQHLELSDLLPSGDFGRHFKFDLPAAVLICLQQLTHLQVVDTEMRMQHFSCLSKLQYFRLHAQCNYRRKRKVPDLNQLTALQDLDLNKVTLDPAALHGCTTLRRLSMVNASIVSSSNNSGGQALLSLIAQQQDMQHLHMVFLDCDWPPACSAYTALSASSKLQRLHFLFDKLPAVAWQWVFRPQQLPQLHSFAFNEEEWATAFTQQDLDALVSSCPALQHLYFVVQPGVELTALGQLTALERINICTEEQMPLSSLAFATNLRSLSHLDLRGERVSLYELRQLTSLQS